MNGLLYCQEPQKQVLTPTIAEEILRSWETGLFLYR